MSPFSFSPLFFSWGGGGGGRKEHVHLITITREEEGGGEKEIEVTYVPMNIIQIAVK